MQSDAVVAAQLIKLGGQSRQAGIVVLQLVFQQMDLPGAEALGGVRCCRAQQCGGLHRPQQSGEVLFELVAQAQQIEGAQFTGGQTQGPACPA